MEDLLCGEKLFSHTCFSPTQRFHNVDSPKSFYIQYTSQTAKGCIIGLLFHKGNCGILYNHSARMKIFSCFSLWLFV